MLLTVIIIWYYHCIVEMFELLEVNDMSRISEEQVRHVANLARLAVTEEDVNMFTKDLDSIIKYAELLDEVDTSNVEPTTHVLNIKNVLREDEPRQWLSQEEVLKNAPDHKNGQIRVPSIIE